MGIFDNLSNHNMCFSVKIGLEKVTFVFERLVQVLVIHLSNLVWIGAKKAGAGAAESRCKLSGKRREKKNANKKQKSKPKARLKKKSH